MVVYTCKNNGRKTTHNPDLICPSRINAGGVYFKLGPVDPTFIRGPAFNRENTIILFSSALTFS